MTYPYARGAKGIRLKGYAPVNYGSNVSVLSAMRRDGVMISLRFEGATTCWVFLAFYRHALIPKL